jgi:hypothetical protein
MPAIARRQGRTPHQHQPLSIFRWVRKEMTVGIGISRLTVWHHWKKIGLAAHMLRRAEYRRR